MNRDVLYAILIFIAGSSYGFIVPAVKIFQDYGVDVNDLLPVQYAIALIVMIVATAITWKNSRHPQGLGYLKLASLGVFASLTSLCYYRAVSLLPGAAALTMLFQFVWISPLIDCITSKKLPSKSTVAAIVVVLIGTLFAAGVFEGELGSLEPLGIVTGLLSAVFYSLFLFLSGHIGTGYSLPIRTSMLCLGGLALTTAINPSAFLYATGNPIVFACAVVTSFIGVLIPTSLIAFASPKLDASVVSIMASSELPVGVVAAWLIVGETPSPLVTFGVILVLAGIVIHQTPSIIGKSHD